MADVVILSYGVSYAQKTMLAFRALGWTCAVVPGDQVAPEEVLRESPNAVVYGASGLESALSDVRPELLSLPIPALGICNGAQILARHLGGHVDRNRCREDGVFPYYVRRSTASFFAVPPRAAAARMVVMEHDFIVTRLPRDCAVLGSTNLTPVADFESWRFGWPILGVQYHPEDPRTTFGAPLLRRFMLVSSAFRKCRKVSRLLRPHLA